MDDLAGDLRERLRRGERFAVATVVATMRSAPRPAGAQMVVTVDGEAIGSISGGCVEGAVYEAAQAALADGRPRLEHYGVSDDEAFGVGLACGGTISVFVEEATPATWDHLDEVLDAVAARRPIVVATITTGPDAGRHVVIESTGTEPRSGVDPVGDAIRGAAGDVLAARIPRAGLVSLGEGPDAAQAFLDPILPPPTMLVFGSIDFAGALVRVGSLLGYRVTVCDARAVFTTRARFPEADEVVVDWPHRFLERTHVDERTVICVLTHDPKYDVPALVAALRTDAGYVGAMGSRRTHADRLVRLREAGVSEDELARLHSPIGLDLGASTPEETAVAIAAEILAARTGADARPLRDGTEPIHRPVPPPS